MAEGVTGEVSVNQQMEAEGRDNELHWRQGTDSFTLGMCP